MNRWCRNFLCAAALAVGGFSAVSAEACPMCKVAHEDATDPAIAARPRAYMYSILFMLSMPATLFTIFGVTFYRLSKKQQLMNQQLMLDEGRTIE